jgi:hypothetical protein
LQSLALSIAVANDRLTAEQRLDNIVLLDERVERDRNNVIPGS